MTELKVVKSIVDTCSKYQLENIFSPVADLSDSCTKAEMISNCLNL